VALEALQQHLLELSVVTQLFCVLSNTLATNHMWLLDVVSATEDLKF
jgi:hypothetical protein